jgi:hypothetical protein
LLPLERECRRWNRRIEPVNQMNHPHADLKASRALNAWQVKSEPHVELARSFEGRECTDFCQIDHDVILGGKRFSAQLGSSVVLARIQFPGIRPEVFALCTEMAANVGKMP